MHFSARQQTPNPDPRHGICTLETLCYEPETISPAPCRSPRMRGAFRPGHHATVRHLITHLGHPFSLEDDSFSVPYFVGEVLRALGWDPARRNSIS